MPNVFLYGASKETNETPEIAITFLGRIRLAFASLKDTSFMKAFLIGRLRHPKVHRAFNQFVANGFFERIRQPFVDLITYTKALAYFAVSSPASLVPEGQVWHDTKSLESSPIIRGGNYDISYEFVGKKLETLFVNFTIKSLSGETLIDKGFRLIPGGICVDSIVKLNEKDQITGSIFLLPHETTNLPEEVKYAISIGEKNLSSRRYFTNMGFMTTVNP